MTTWHENEPLSEAFWFAGHCAFHSNDVALDQTLILHIGPEEQRAGLLQAFAEAQHS
jgi:hypothetical protein